MRAFRRCEEPADEDLEGNDSGEVLLLISPPSKPRVMLSKADQLTEGEREELRAPPWMDPEGDGDFTGERLGTGDILGEAAVEGIRSNR